MNPLVQKLQVINIVIEKHFNVLLFFTRRLLRFCCSSYQSRHLFVYMGGHVFIYMGGQLESFTCTQVHCLPYTLVGFVMPCFSCVGQSHTMVANVVVETHV